MSLMHEERINETVEYFRRLSTGFSLKKVSPSYSVFDILACFFLDAFAKLRKETVGFVVSIRLHGTARRPLGGFA